MSKLRPSASSSDRLGPVYSFPSADEMDGIVHEGQLVLLMGNDPQPLLVNFLASEACLWERPSLCFCLRTAPVELTTSLLSSISGADSTAVQSQRIAAHSFGSVNAAALDLFYAPLQCCESQEPVSVLTLERVFAKAKKRSVAREVFVDDIRRLAAVSGEAHPKGNLQSVCHDLTALARREHVITWACLPSMDLNAAKPLCDVAIRLEGLGGGTARLGVQTRDDTRPHFRLARLNPACSRLEKFRRSPWEETCAKRFKAARKS